MNETQKLQHSHSSVRRYEERPIPRDLLERLIACGQSASSSSFVQAYSLVRVTDAGKRRIIAEAAGGQRWVVEAAEFLVICADLQRLDHACRISCAGELEGWTEHFLIATVDAALMAQNLMLAAESEGLGGVFIGGIRNNPQPVADCLELPELVYPAFGLCLGWPAERHPVKPRLPVAAVLHENRYDGERIASDIAAYDRIMSDYFASRGQNAKHSTWSEQVATALQGKKREHMLAFLQSKGFLLR